MVFWIKFDENDALIYWLINDLLSKEVTVFNWKLCWKWIRMFSFRKRIDNDSCLNIHFVFILQTENSLFSWIHFAKFPFGFVPTLYHHFRSFIRSFVLSLLRISHSFFQRLSEKKESIPQNIGNNQINRIPRKTFISK